MSIDSTSVTARGFAHDLQKNNYVELEARKLIVNKYGRRYSDDMVNVTAMAACAIAYRNCLFKVIPRSLTDPILAAARKAALGDQKTLTTRRAQAFAHFEKMGLTRDQILARLEKPGIEDVDLDDLELLTGLKTALREGEISIAEAFPEDAGEEAETDRAATLADKIRKRRQLQAPAAAESQESGT